MHDTPSFENLLPTFDWYQATTETDPRELFEALQPFTHDNPLHDEKPKLRGYAHAKKTGGPGGSLLVHYGGPNGDTYGPNVAGTGPMAPAVSDLLRAARLPHLVSRADVRLDFLAEWDPCRLAFIDRCNRAGMASRDNGSSPESSVQLGRTVYGGSPKSAYTPTLYQKGLQLGKPYPQNYLRLEHRFAFSRRIEKLQLATLTPEQMIGLRPVARDLTRDICGLAVAPYRQDKAPPAETPYTWMLRQYGQVLRTMLDDLGSPECVGKQIFDDLNELEPLQ